MPSIVVIVCETEALKVVGFLLYIQLHVDLWYIDDDHIQSLEDTGGRIKESTMCHVHLALAIQLPTHAQAAMKANCKYLTKPGSVACCLLP
jgi:hypothetical protein